MYKKYKYISLEKQEAKATLWLNRPKAHNAFHREMILEILDALQFISESKNFKLLIIQGKGKSFCAGADIHWMNSENAHDFEQVKADSELLAQLFQMIYKQKIPVISVVQGAISGGANGIISAGDFVYAHKNARFVLPAAKLGLAPSTILPYLMTRVSLKDIKKLVFTANPISAVTAKEISLCDEVFNSIEAIEQEVNEFAQRLEKTSIEAIRNFKSLTQKITQPIMTEEALTESIKSISELKSSEQAIQRMNAFFAQKNDISKN